LTTARERVNTSLGHQTPDRNPVDFLATPEIWQKLLDHFGISEHVESHSDYLEMRWELVLKELAVDCRVLSYDQFFVPPPSFLKPNAQVDWYGSLGRSTPNRMWRQCCVDGSIFDIWGRGFEVMQNPTGAYEQNTIFPLSTFQGIQEIKTHTWPQPDWWDFSQVDQVVNTINGESEYHFRYRIGSVFEVAWQLVGLEKFMMDLTMQPELPMYLMETLTDIYLAVTERFLQQAGQTVDMVYFYDDVASQNNLLISKKMWEKYIKPHHQKIIDLAIKYSKKVMYHSDGAMDKLIPELIDMGVDVLNPIQKDAVGMDPVHLKQAYGDKLAFHGGIDIIRTLPEGTPAEVAHEVRDCVSTLGKKGGYIMASSHHIQSNTPLENVLEMYDLQNRQVG
jgi:uroporphyrinogen decarboxylase